jgi:hypothetical protein
MVVCVDMMAGHPQLVNAGVLDSITHLGGCHTDIAWASPILSSC